MKRQTLVHLALTAVILAAGCAYDQLRIPAGPRLAAPPAPDIPETVLRDVKLNSGRHVQGQTGLIGRATQVLLDLARDHDGSGANHRTDTTTVGALKARGLFLGSVLSDDSVVLCMEARGGFVQMTEEDGHTRAINYKTLVAMFDPSRGDLLSYGLIP